MSAPQDVARPPARAAADGWWFARPGRAGAVAIVGHVAVWTAVPSLVNPNLPLDVIEGLAWGHAWQWGYYKHPPLSAWLMELAAMLAPGHGWPLYLLSAVSVGIAFWVVWTLARDLLAPVPALIALMLLEGVIYHTVTSPEYNANVALLPLWALAMLFMWRGLQRGRMADWVLCGLAVGAGVLAKYFTAFLIVPMAALVLLPGFRAHLRTAGPYLAAAAATAVVAPHLAWIADNGFVTIGYGLARATATGGDWWGRHVLGPLNFVLAQGGAIAPAALLMAALGWPAWRLARGAPRHDVFLAGLGLGPLALVVMVGAIAGFHLRSMWGTPLFLLSGLMAVAWLAPALERANLRRFFRAWLAVALLGPLVYGAIAVAEPYVADRGKRVHYPGRALAAAVSAAWRDVSEAPLAYVVGPVWAAGNAAYYNADRPQVHIDGNPARAPWIDEADVRRQGAVLLWGAGPNGAAPPRLAGSPLAGFAARFGCIEERPALVLPWDTGADLPPVRIGWAVLRPAALCAGAE